VRIALALALLLGGATAASAGVISALDLSKPFGTRSEWRFVATQGPEVDSPATMPGDKEPGAIALCLSKDGGRSCQPDLRQAPRFTDDIFVEPHYLEMAEIVHPAPGRVLLLLRTASVHSGDGDQLVLTRLLAYDHQNDRFVPVYAQSTGRNNNQEIRYVGTGPLRGAVIAAEPTEKAPFGYWITLSRAGTGGLYRQVLHFRSATRYGDGNALGVIDSEMPNIKQRLGLWRPGAPLPLPAGPCPHPHLVHTALWCS
jgi:hypothetical protein